MNVKLKAAPDHYERRVIFSHATKKTHPWRNGKWMVTKWEGLRPNTFLGAQKMIDEWNSDCEASGMRVQYRLPEGDTMPQFYTMFYKRWGDEIHWRSFMNSNAVAVDKSRLTKAEAEAAVAKWNATQTPGGLWRFSLTKEFPEQIADTQTTSVTHFWRKDTLDSSVGARRAFPKPMTLSAASAAVEKWNMMCGWTRYAVDATSTVKQTVNSLPLLKFPKKYDADGWESLNGSAPQSSKGKAALKIVRKIGDVWKLDKTSSPMWTEQWAYKGTAVAPYIISRKVHTALTTWACSCPNWTRNTPRTDCKHILKVRLDLGEKVSKTTPKIAGLDAAQQKEFEKWQRERAAQGQPVLKGEGEETLNLFGKTGRKFR